MAICTRRCCRRPSGCWSATGWPGLTLRAVAREAGVSHAAPTHHFGDLTGLVSELAAIGFRQFNAAMSAARASRHHAAREGDGERQGLCRLCAGASRHVRADVPHRAARSFAAVAARGRRSRRSRGSPAPSAASRQEQISEESLSLDQAAAIARTWSLVHGFTMLLLDGRPQGHPAPVARGHDGGAAAGRHDARGHRSPARATGSGLALRQPDGDAGIADQLHRAAECLGACR